MFDNGVANLRIELLCASLTPPIRLDGRITQVEGRNCWLKMSDPIPPILTPDLGVVLDVCDHSSLHIVGVIRATDPSGMKVEITRVAHHEKRYFPREDGGLEVQFKPVEGPLEKVSKGWIQGLHEVDAESWQHPPPFMNVSGSGLRFQVKHELPAGAGLLLSFRIPEDDASYRATARVVRCDEHGQATHAAVEFVDIPPDAVQALADFTMERQLEQLAAAAF